MDRVLLAFIIIFPQALLLTPVILFLVRGWCIRKENTIGGFTDRAIDLYFCYYCTFIARNSGGSAKALSDLFDARFGRRYFLLPVILICFAGVVFSLLIVAFLVSKGLFAPAGLFDVNVVLADGVTIGALLGAYIWSFLSLQSKSQQRNMHPSDILACCFRFFISVPIAHAFSLILADNAAAVVAVFLGAFPLQAILSAMRRAVPSKGLAIESRDSQLELKGRIQGINLEIAERLEEWGISTIVQLAYCDPIDVAIRSGYEINWITDWQTQAIVSTYYPDDKQLLDRYGLRGTIEIGGLLEDLEGDEKTYSQRAQVLITSLASELKRPPEVVIRTFFEIAYDPYSTFLRELWGQVGGNNGHDGEATRTGSPGSWSAPPQAR